MPLLIIQSDREHSNILKLKLHETKKANSVKEESLIFL